MSGNGYYGKVTNRQREITGRQTLSEREAIWGELDGEIVDFDPQNQTATIKPIYTRKQWDGSDLPLPELLEVPVRFPTGGGGGMTLPVGKGTMVTLRPKMRSSEKYHTEGSGESSDYRSFSLADMEAHLDGGESLLDPIKGFDAANTHVRFDPDGKYGLRGNTEGKFALDGGLGDAYQLIARIAEIVAEHETNVTKGSSTGTYSHTLAAEAAQIAAKLRGMALKG